MHYLIFCPVLHWVGDVVALKKMSFVNSGIFTSSNIGS